jgi:23S rRNA pseudouridine2605 synthase
MADKSTPKGATGAAAGATPEGERIAKVLSRRGVASRREAERLIEAGEVTVNGKVIESPALNVTPRDRITISGHPLPAEEPARLWLYYKPEGLVTSTADEKGRDTVFDHLPEDMPRVMSVGRLDLNSEGLLLLTNDGALKRRLELPSTGWLRKYRVRVNGNPADPDLDPLRKGITVEGEAFQPMQVTLDRVQGANAWLTVGLREGKNREIRRAMNAIGLYVNRLIRVSYGPFRLGELQPGEVEEVRPKVLRDQLGESPQAEEAETPAAKKPQRSLRPRRAGPAATAPSRPSAGKPAAGKPSTGKPSTGKPAARAGGKPDPRPARGDAGPAPLPRPVKPGDGIRILSRAWKEAVTPVSPEDRAARDSSAKPRRGAGAASDAATPRGKPGAKPAGKPAPKSAPSGAAPKRPAAPAKPPGKRPDAPTRRGTPERGGTRRK